ncbi:MAG: NfeD family protein [Alphaproteobacteria bacterium]
MMQIDFWYWWVLAVVLFTLEAFAPGAVFLWMGISASLVGILLLILPDLTWQLQGLSFAVLSIVAALGGRQILKRKPIHTDEPALNKRGTALIGRIGVLEHPIQSGIGKIRLDDTVWRVLGPDLPTGTQVQVIGVEGASLRVIPANKS